MIKTTLSAAVLAVALPVMGHAAATTTITFGDEDCFGLGTSSPCTSLPNPTTGPDYFDNSNVLDPVGQDQYGVIGMQSYDINLSFGTREIDSVELILRWAGLDIGFGADFAGGGVATDPDGASVQVNGTQIDVLKDPIGNPLAIHETTTVFDKALIDKNGVNTFKIIPEMDFNLLEDWALDFVKLRIVSSDPGTGGGGGTVVPLPGSLSLMLAGLGLAGVVAARRKAR